MTNHATDTISETETGEERGRPPGEPQTNPDPRGVFADPPEVPEDPLPSSEVHLGYLRQPRIAELSCAPSNLSATSAPLAPLYSPSAEPGIHRETPPKAAQIPSYLSSSDPSDPSDPSYPSYPSDPLHGFSASSKCSSPPHSRPRRLQQLRHTLANIFVDDSLKDEGSRFMAIAVTLFAALGGLLYGYDTGIITGLLAMQYMKENFSDSGVEFSSRESSLATSILSAGTFLGSSCSPLLSDTLGRRWALMIASFVFFTVGLVLQMISTSLALLCTGRAITGIAVGIVSAVVPVYQSEAAPKWIRGAVVSTYQLAITIGLLLASVVTQAMHKRMDPSCYRVPIGVQFIWSATLGIGMWFLPDTPRFFVKKDQLDRAAHSLAILRRLPINHPALIEELVEIKANHDYELSFGQPSLLDCFRGANHQLKRLLTGMGLQALQQLTGINFIFYYGTNFFLKVGIGNSFLIQMVMNVVNVSTTIPGILLVEFIGRRKLLMLGAAAMVVCDFVIAIVTVTVDSVRSNQILIAFSCLYIAAFASSWGPGAWVYIGEVFPLRTRGKSVALSAATNWLFNFAIAFATPYLVDQGPRNAGLGAKVFFIWGSCNVISFNFVFFLLYETRGLSLEEIDEMFLVTTNARQSVKFVPSEAGFTGRAGMGNDAGIELRTQPSRLSRNGGVESTGISTAADTAKQESPSGSSEGPKCAPEVSSLPESATDGGNDYLDYLKTLQAEAGRDTDGAPLPTGHGVMRAAGLPPDAGDDDNDDANDDDDNYNDFQDVREQPAFHSFQPVQLNDQNFLFRSEGPPDL